MIDQPEEFRTMDKMAPMLTKLLALLEVKEVAYRKDGIQFRYNGCEVTVKIKRNEIKSGKS